MKDSDINYNQYSIHHSLAYLDELISILYYINYLLKNPRASELLYLDIKAAIDGLSTFPNRYQIVKNNIRKVIVKNYNIYYSVDEQLKIVNILHILYKGMDISKICE